MMGCSLIRYRWRRGNFKDSMEVSMVIQQSSTWKKVLFGTCLTGALICSGQSAAFASTHAGTTGAIQGAVSSPGGGQLDGICVSANGVNYPNATLTATTGSNGTYRIPGIVPGPYLISFGACGSLPQGMVPVWYDQQPAKAAASAVTVSAGLTTTGIDAVLGLSGEIRGEVTRAANATALAGVCVSAYASADPGGAPIATDTSAKNGSYTLLGLIAGNYLINFGGCGLPNNRLPSTWYGGQATSSTSPSVAVGWGQSTDHIDQALEASGSIRGTVHNQLGGGPVSGICVQAYLDSIPTAAALASTTTTTDGSYVFSSLPPATYLVSFGYCDVNSDYLPQWYGNTPSAASSLPIVVGSGSSVGKIDASLTPMGRISGSVVTSVSNFGIRNAGSVCINVFSSDDPSGPAIATESVTPQHLRGRIRAYVLPVPAGTDLVEFAGCPSPSKWQTAWYGGSSESTATPVKVGIGRGTPHVTADMELTPLPPPPGILQGVVSKSPGGGKVGGLCAAAYLSTDPQGSAVGTATTDSDGYYELPLAPGSYLVNFGGCGGLPTGYLGQWYQNQATESAATPVAVTSGRRTNAIDASLIAS
jgi:hypothetical protein